MKLRIGGPAPTGMVKVGANHYVDRKGKHWYESSMGDMDNEHQYVAVSDDAATAPQTFDTFVHSDTVKTASALALTYHGYRRTGSLLWALLYGAAGRFIPTVAVPVAVAQGFGKKRTCTTE